MWEKKAYMIHLPKVVDPRGNLTVAEQGIHVPFDIARVYWTYDIPGGESRGGHAHRHCEEVIIAASGSFDVIPSAEDRIYRYTAFRLSNRDGIIPDGPGTVYYLEFEPDQVTDPGSSRDSRNAVHYRIPAVCNVKLTSGGKTLFQSRIPVYQLGAESLYLLR